MDIEIEVVSSSYNVSLDLSQTIEIEPNVMRVTRFTDLIDFNDDNKYDQYVIMYNATTGEYDLVNPDKVFSSAAVDETRQPGLPGDFENVLDVDLDNRIDLDAGNF